MQKQANETSKRENPMTTSWKRTLTGLAAAVTMTATPLAAHAGCGDVNKNGSIEVGDALALASKIAATSDCGADKADCDVRKDGSVDILDLNNMVAQIAGLKTLFDSCTGPGTAVACTDGTDPDTGLPVHNVNPGDITSNQKWPNTCTIHLLGIVFVKTQTGSPTTVLTIEPGTVVKGVGGGTSDPAVLIVLPGARIDAQGTASQPIIMTSGQPFGSRSVGDWGGLVINGKSTVNRPNCINNAEGIPAPYGGCDSSDNSGVLTYTRVEFSGIEFTPNNELNVITLNGVGNGTQIDHIQANAGGDDCIEWFGGTVNVKYIVASGCADDGFDYQLGTTGTRQYGLQVQYGPVLQTGNQSRGIEADNSEFGFDDLPRSNPKFCNLTMVGARDNDPNLGSQAGLFFRRGTAGTVANSIVTNYRDGCVRMDDSSTSRFACANSTTLQTTAPFLDVQNTLCFDNGGTGGFGTASRVCSGSTSGGNCSSCQWYSLLNANKSVSPAPGHCTPTATTQPCSQNSDCTTMGDTCTATNVGQNPHFAVPYGGGATRWDDVLSTGGGYPANVPDLRPTSVGGFPAVTDCHALDDALETTTYLGAFDPAGGNWLDTPVMAGSAPISLRRWISFDVN